MNINPSPSVNPKCACFACFSRPSAYRVQPRVNCWFPGQSNRSPASKWSALDIFTRFRTLRIHEIYEMILSLKLTYVALEDVCLEDDCFILGWLPGRCHVSFRECRDIQYWMISSFGVFSLGLLTSWNRKGDGSPLKSHK